MPDTKTKTTLHQDVEATLKRLEAKDKGLGQLIKKAHGHAVFPSVGKASLVIGGSYGRGLVFEKGKFIGYATITQLTLGVQIGGDTFSEVLIFESRQALDRFKQGKMAFAANASAVLVKAAAAGTADFPRGVQALAYSRGGMLLEAAIGAQKFKFKPADEEQEDDQDQGEGTKGGSKGKSGQKQQNQGQSSGEEDQEQQEEEGGEGESGGILSRATGVLRDHPIAATLVGVGLAGAAMLLVRKLRDTGSESDDASDDDDQGSQEDDDQAEASSDQDEGDYEGQDERGSNSRVEEDEGDEDDRGGRGGDMLGFLRRRRSRA